MPGTKGRPARLLEFDCPQAGCTATNSGSAEESQAVSRQRQQDGDTRTHLTFAQYQWEAVDVLARDLAEAQERLGEARRAKEVQENRAQRVQAALFAIHATVCAVTAAVESAEGDCLLGPFLSVAVHR